MGICHCCLKESEHDFCNSCSKQLFGTTRFPSTIGLTIPETALKKTGSVNRISISGAQVKFSAKIEDKKLVNTEQGGTFILKPPLAQHYRNNQDSPANEHITMLMARTLFKIPTAHSALIHFADGNPGYITKRFDIIENGEDRGKKLDQYDFAQIGQLSPEKHGSDYKYRAISYERIAELIKEHISAHVTAKETFFKIILFNYLVANGDAHVKNFSIRNFADNRDTFELAPAYDLLNTSLHMSEDSRTALDLFKDETEFCTPFYKANGFYGKPDFMEFARRIGLVEVRAERFIQQTINSVQPMEEMIDKSFLSDTGKQFYKDSIRDRAKVLSLTSL